MGGGGETEEIRRMVPYVHLLRRTGEHRRENVFLAGHRTKKKCFSFVQEIIFSQTIVLKIFTLYMQNLTLRETAL